MKFSIYIIYDTEKSAYIWEYNNTFIYHIAGLEIISYAQINSKISHLIYKEVDSVDYEINKLKIKYL